ncbi:MAG: hypothetical protein ACH350_10670, partial [Parachlamydiaceae bacterium]
LDHFFTGVNTAITGKYGDTITSQLLQMGGVSAENATTIDHLMSIGGCIGGARLAMNAASSSVPQIVKSAGHLGMDQIKYVSKRGVALSRGAENVNAAADLNRKLSRLENFQQTSTRARTLPDGRIRYYDAENLSRTVGPTRGACNVVEWNPRTGNVRGWYECHDHLGNVNRVHPKNINGQVISLPHYPPIGTELMR